MKKLLNSAGIALILSVGFTSVSMAQCKGFVNQEINMLSPFIYSGKPNHAVLMPGDHSELALTFYAGQTYRIIMKSAESSANIAFSIKDSKGKLVFKSNKEEQADYYDFTSDTTQMLTVEMMALESITPAEPGPSQCVVVLVGQKE